MKRSISPILKLSGKPINVAKEKKHLTYDEMGLRHELLRILRNSNYPTLLPSSIPRKGFIRAASKLHRWVIAGRVPRGYKGDYDPDRLSYYSRMFKGVPIFNNNRIRVYKTRSGAERAKQRLIDTGMFLAHNISLIRT